MALLAARAAAAAAEALGGALAASFRNLGLRECATSTGASALEELQRAATASAAAAAATFRHWQDGQAAPKPSATTTGNGSSKTAQRRRQRRRHQQREASAGRAPETPPAHHGTDADAGGGAISPPRPPAEGPQGNATLQAVTVQATRPPASRALEGELALVQQDRAKPSRPAAPPSSLSRPPETKRGRAAEGPLAALWRGVGATTPAPRT